MDWQPAEETYDVKHGSTENEWAVVDAVSYKNEKAEAGKNLVIHPCLRTQRCQLP